MPMIAAEWEKVTDIVEVWFDSGSTHAFVLEQRPELRWPADLYLEGSDQHRGWFQSSLIEACGTRGRAPYDAVLTHGFVLDEDGRKMSKSLGNVIPPQQIMQQSGADILRLWVVGSDYSEDVRIGPEILKRHSDAYRRLRNTLRPRGGRGLGDGRLPRTHDADDQNPRHRSGRLSRLHDSLLARTPASPATRQAGIPRRIARRGSVQRGRCSTTPAASARKDQTRSRPTYRSMRRSPWRRCFA